MQKSPLLLASFFLLSAAAMADQTPVANTAGVAPCLIGDEAGICSKGDGGSEYLNTRSIVAQISDDLRREYGVDGQFERVSDSLDGIWKLSSAAKNKTIRIRVRASYENFAYEFGLRNLGLSSDPSSPSTPGLLSAPAAPAFVVARAIRRLQPADFSLGFKSVVPRIFAPENRILLTSCQASYQPSKDGKARCTEFRNLPLFPSSTFTTASADSPFFLFGLKRMDALPNDNGAASTFSNRAKEIATNIVGPRKEFSYSHPAANNGADRMVSFRFNQKVRIEDGTESAIYLLAFNAEKPSPSSQFNHYVVEVQMAEPGSEVLNESVPALIAPYKN